MFSTRHSRSLIRWGTVGGGAAGVVWAVVFVAFVALLALWAVFKDVPPPEANRFSLIMIRALDVLPVIIASLCILAVVLMLVGLAGLHVRQSPSLRYGRTGSVGFLVSCIGISLLLVTLVTVAFVQDTYSDASEVLLAGGELSSFLFMFIGFTLLGFAVLRAKVLPRWFGYLLFVHVPSLALLLLAIYRTLIPELGPTSRVPVIPSLVAPLTLAFLWLSLGYVLWSTAPPKVGIVSQTIGLRARRLQKWTGFSEKTLWDWMQLSITASIPVLLAIGGLLFNAAQNERNKATEEWRAQDAALQNYYNVMSDLLTNKGLRNSEPDSEVRTLAGAQTATVLARFQADVGERDPEREKVYGPTSATLTSGSAARKANILKFLYDSDLITKNHPVVKLSGDDLTNIDTSSRSNLAKADLSGAKLQQADLSYINLSAADLSGADLSYADLTGTDLSGADLSKANLHKASLVNTDLRDTIGLTPAQIDLSIGNETTRLPSDLQFPESWLRWDAREQEEIYGVSKSRSSR